MLDANSEETWKVRNLAPSAAFRTSIRGLWESALANLETPNPMAVAEALRQLEQLPEAKIGAAKENSEETEPEQTLDTLFTIDAEVVIPPDGYGLNPFRRFLITFGRRKHINSASSR
jgi:hypothetical protein